MLFLSSECCRERVWFGLRAIRDSESFIQFDPSSITELKQKNTHRYVEEAAERQIKLKALEQKHRPVLNNPIH